MMGVNTRNIYSCLQKCNKLNKLHLAGQLLNSIHDARTHIYIKYIYIFPPPIFSLWYHNIKITSYSLSFVCDICVL